MNKLLRTLSAGFILLASFNVAAFADPRGSSSNINSGGFNINKDQLPRADKIERSRLKIQIVDDGPEVSDLRKPLEGPNNLQIFVGPRPVAEGKTTVIGDPANAIGGGMVQVPLSRNGLPQAGFERYFKQNQVAPLPQGTSTGVHGPTATPIATNSSGQKIVSGHLKPGLRPQNISASGYNDYTHPVSSSASTTAVGKVTGTLTSPLKSRLGTN